VRGRIGIQSGCYSFQHAIHVADDVVIPESKDSIVVFAKPLITHTIANAIRVLAAIKFDYQSLLATNEVNDVTTHRLLKDEFVVVD